MISSNNSPPRDVVISVKDLRKRYFQVRNAIDPIKFLLFGRESEAREILAGVNFEITQGESVGILGRNGAGKSTLLQLLTKNLNASSGEVETKGSIAALLELGVGFNGELTGRENANQYLSIHGVPSTKINSLVEEIREFSELGEYFEKPVRTYSSGMFVRLAFASAIFSEPDILIIDEALAVGDLFFQQKCIRFLKEIFSNKTRIFVSHDLNSLCRLCDRIIVIENGKVFFDGDPITAVEKFTGLVHENTFGSSKTSSHSHKKLESHPDFELIDQSFLSGTREAWISAVRFEVDFSRQRSVRPGQNVDMSFIVGASTDIDELIVGYFFRDEQGVPIFGENSMRGDTSFVLREDEMSVIKLSFIWPEVKPGQYSLTLGLGRGKDPHVHKILCWAHNIFELTAISPKTAIHGMFNVPIQQIEIGRVE